MGEKPKSHSHILAGAWDLHIHTAPDISERIGDDFQLAKRAKQKGFEGIVIKNHFFPTQERATIVSNKLHLKVFGGIALNLSVGGFNPIAVELALALGAKIVWMPTVHAKWVLKDQDHLLASSLVKSITKKGLTILDEKKKIRNEVEEILELISKYDAILATGHLSPEEIVLLTKEAINQKVDRILLTHPFSSEIGMTIATIKEMMAKKYDFFVEFTYYDMITHANISLPLGFVATCIKEVGVERVILTSDGGQSFNPPPDKMFLNFIRELGTVGFKDEELQLMIKNNPRKLLF